MGEFISKLITDNEKVEIINSSEIKGCSLFKLKEYQANYQMICESFSINFTEFEQIFGNFQNQNEFYLWDTDLNGVIDSFELFCGLILFSDCATEDKIKCLFELFDFNHSQSLAFYDLSFMIESCISSCFKMHKLGIEIPSREPKVNFNRSLRIIAILLADTSSICFMIPVSCLVLSFVIIVTPIYPINPCKYIIDNMEDYDGGWVY